MPIRCPNKPNPVISVQAEAEHAAMASAASLFNRAIDSAIISYVSPSSGTGFPAHGAWPICRAKLQHSHTERLGEHQHIAALRGAAFHEGIGMNGAGDGEAQLDLVVFEAVSSEECHPGFAKTAIAPLSIRYINWPSSVSLGKARMLNAVCGVPPMA